MWYSIVTTGKCVATESYTEVERIKKLYLYPKIRRHQTAEEADNFVKTQGYNEAIQRLRNYGNSIKGFTIHAKYKITPTSLYIFYDTRDIGDIILKELEGKNLIMERTGYVTKIKLEHSGMSNYSLKDHLKAVHTVVNMIGGSFCVNVHIQYFSVYYALTLFPGNQGGSCSISSSLSKEQMAGLAWSYGDYQEE